MKIRFLFFLFVCGSFTCLASQERVNHSVYEAISLTRVSFHNGFWKQYIARNSKVTVPYCINKCTESGCLHNFQLAAGEADGSYQSDNTWLDSDMYKALEAAFYSMMVNPDHVLLSKTDSIVDIIIKAQEKDGYLYTARTTHATHPRVVHFMGKQRWTNMGHFSHELYNMGHMIEAAVAHYQLTGNKRFLNAAIKTADLIVDTFGKGKLTYPPGHQEVELALVKLYKQTGNKAYLETACYLLEARGVYTNRSPYTDEFFKEYHQDHLSVADQKEAVGHAVRAVYMYAAMADIVDQTRNEQYKVALDSIWKDVMERKIYITGGIGNQQLGEAFGKPYQLDNLKAYTETCAAIGLALWSERMFAINQDSKYYDVIERTVYNGILSGISQDGMHFYYKNPLESKGDKQRTEWNSCACCPPNLARYIASMGNRMYGINGSRLFINMYAANHANMNMKGNNIDILQKTDYPWNGNITLNINPEKDQKFDIFLRLPGWCFNQLLPGKLYPIFDRDNTEGLPVVWVNGNKVDYRIEKGYAVIHKKWSKGDVIKLELQMKPQRVTARLEVASNKNRMAVICGPILYCAEEIDNQTPWEQLDFSLSDQVFLSTYTDRTLQSPFIEIASHKLIPYFLWANRGVCKMKVWIPISDK